MLDAIGVPSNLMSREERLGNKIEPSESNYWKQLSKENLKEKTTEGK